MRCAQATCIVVVVCAVRAAHATRPEVATAEFGDWAHTVAALQRDLYAQGTRLHIAVKDGDAPVGCGDYSLTLDEAGAQAFRLEACAPSTGVTDAVLVDRSALFTHVTVVPQARVIRLDAVVVRSVVEAGGAGIDGSNLPCSATVRPYLEDLEHGTRTYLAPGRFVLRPAGANLVAEGLSDGWVLRSNPRDDLNVGYVVVDTQTNAAVLQDRATLTCAAVRPVCSDANFSRNSHPTTDRQIEVRFDAGGRHVEVRSPWNGDTCKTPCTLDVPLNMSPTLLSVDGDPVLRGQLAVGPGPTVVHVGSTAHTRNAGIVSLVAGAIGTIMLLPSVVIVSSSGWDQVGVTWLTVDLGLAATSFAVGSQLVNPPTRFDLVRPMTPDEVIHPILRPDAPRITAAGVTPVHGGLAAGISFSF